MPSVNNGPAQGNFFGTNPSSGVGSIGSVGLGVGSSNARDFGGNAALAPALFHNWMTGSGATLGQVLAFTSAGIAWTNASPLPPTTGGPFVMFGGAWTAMPNVCTPPPGTPTGFVMVATSASPGYTWVDANTVTQNPMIPPAGTLPGSIIKYDVNATPQFTWVVPGPGTAIPNPPVSGGPYALSTANGTSSWVALPTGPSQSAVIPQQPTSGGPYVLQSNSTGVMSWVPATSSSLSEYRIIMGGWVVGPHLTSNGLPGFISLVSGGIYDRVFETVGATTVATSPTGLTVASPPGVVSYVMVMINFTDGTNVPVGFPSTAPVGTPINLNIINTLL